MLLSTSYSAYQVTVACKAIKCLLKRQRDAFQPLKSTLMNESSSNSLMYFMSQS